MELFFVNTSAKLVGGSSVPLSQGRDRSPGPARYLVKSDFEKYGMHHRIENAAKAIERAQFQSRVPE
eukprot:4448187-Amphidinium_carterae.1